MSLPLKILSQQLSYFLKKASYILLSASAVIGCHQDASFAAEEVIFQYGAVSQSVPIEELENFTTTGEKSAAINFLFNFSNQNPQIARQVLAEKLPADTVVISNLLNTLPGEYVLFRVSSLVHPKSERAKVEALRGAIIESASDDNQISLLELLQNYPTQQVYVDGKLLAKTAKNTNNFLDFLELALEMSFYPIKSDQIVNSEL
jgi:hypothetical protein